MVLKGKTDSSPVHHQKNNGLKPPKALTHLLQVSVSLVLPGWASGCALQGVVAEVLPTQTQPHPCSPGRKRLESPSWDGAFQPFTAVTYWACVFKDSVNNYSGLGFFKHTNGIFIKRPFLQKQTKEKKNIYSECVPGQRHWLVFYGKWLGCSGTNRPGGPDLLLSLNWDRCRRNSLCLVCSGPLKEKGFFHPVCLRMPRVTRAQHCPHHCDSPFAISYWTLPRGVRSDGFTLTPSRTFELLGHTNMQLLFWKKSCRHICAWYSATCSRPQQKDFLPI